MFRKKNLTSLNVIFVIDYVPNGYFKEFQAISKSTIANQM